MWWKKYGFSKNPLDIRPNKNLIGVEDIEKEVIYSIENGEIFLLYGPIGSGKTSLAFRVIDKLKDKYNIIYLSGEFDKNKDIEKIIEERKYKKFLFFKLENKNPIVLILDEFYNFDTELSKKLKYLYDNRIVYSIMLIQINSILENTTLSFLNRLFRKIEMKILSEDEILKLIKIRLKNKVKIDENILREIIRKNGRNIRSIFIELNNLLEKGEINKLEVKKSILDIYISERELKILEILYRDKLSTRQISEKLNLPKNIVYKELRKLLRKNIILKEKVGDNNYVYYINPKIINDISKIIGK